MRVFSFFIIISLLLLLLGGCDDPPSQTKLSRGPVWMVFADTNSPLTSNFVTALKGEPSGKVWIGTRKGLLSFEKKSWSSLKIPFSEQDTIITDISIGLSGDIWIAVSSLGIVRYNRGASTFVWQLFTESKELFSNQTTCMLATGGNPQEFWFGSVYGVAKYTPSDFTQDEGVWKKYSKKTSSIPSDMITSLAYNKIDHTTWIGTQDAGITVYSSDRIWTYYLVPPTYNVPVSAIAFDFSNNVWVGTLNGVSVLHLPTSVWTKQYNSINTKHLLPPGPIRTIVTDGMKTRWFGTDNGLSRLSDTTWTTFHPSNSPLPSDFITALEYDAKGNLWIGTENGVVVYNDKGIVF